MQSPSVKVANLASEPKAFWHSLVPVRQLSIQRPITGSVSAITPPVQPSQKDWSALANGAADDAVICRDVVGQKEQQGRSSFMQFTMQVTGNFTVQGVSPQLGLQPLHDILPTQLFFYQGQTVAQKVRPLLVSKAYWQSEQYCQTQRVAARNKLRNRSFLALAMVNYLLYLKNSSVKQLALHTQCNAAYSYGSIRKILRE